MANTGKTAPPFTPVVAALPHTVPFVGPEALERTRGRPFRARLGANESQWGPSPKAVDAMAAAAAESWKYCDPENYDLRDAVARLNGVDSTHVVIGEGIDGLLGLTIQLFIEIGDGVVTSDGAYPTFNFHVLAHGGRLMKVPFHDDHEDLAALLDTARKYAAKIIYVSNPNNPMGTWWPGSAIESMLDQLPSGTLLILDEAYCDTAPRETLPNIDSNDPRVVRYRTFSKAYGVAGARIGYALGHPGTIAAFEKVRNHYGINRTGQIGALAAVKDQDYLSQAVTFIARARDRISVIARDNGLMPIPSAANFVTIDCGRDSAFAKRVLDGLLERDVFARKPAVAPLDRCIRISCGRDADLDVLAEMLPLALAAARTAG